MSEPVMINTNVSSANSAIKRDKNKRQINSLHLAGDFRKRAEDTH